MNRHDPKVSLVIPTYKRAQVVGQTLRTLLAQTFQDIEILVMDDGSPDETEAVIKATSDERVQYFRKEHLGIPHIINAGLEMARGTYVMVCHDHDLYEPTMVEELAALLDRHPSASFAHSGVVIVSPDGTQERGRYVRDYPSISSGRDFLVDHLLPGLSSPVTALTMIRRAALDGGGLDPDFGACSDVELWLRLAEIGDVAYVQKPLMRLRERDQTSDFFDRGLDLAKQPLEAKKKYLPNVQDASCRDQIVGQWRREVTQAGLVLVWKELERGRSEGLPPIVDFVSKEGTPLGAALIRVLCRLPKSPTLLGLRAAKFGNRALRSVREMKRVASAN